MTFSSKIILLSALLASLAGCTVYPATYHPHPVYAAPYPRPPVVVERRFYRPPPVIIERRFGYGHPYYRPRPWGYGHGGHHHWH